MKRHSAKRLRHCYCHHCWRSEFFKPVSFHPAILGLLAIVTVGFVFLCSPARCVTCGKSRMVVFWGNAKSKGDRQFMDDPAC